MTLYGFIFYMVAAVIVAASALAITRRNPVHAVIYLIISFLGSAMLFYLLGAPFLAALEVIIYAGAVMVLFVFVIMIIRVEKAEERGSVLREWGPGTFLGLVYLVIFAIVVFGDPGSGIRLETAAVEPRDFGRFVFQRYWLAIEIISFLLLLALMAAIHIGSGKEREENRG
jgi:NADH-quinone oxidoreductase subunit J